MAADVPHPAFEPYVGEAVPQAPPGSPGKDGRLELDFARAGAETRLVRDFACAPFHVSGTLDHDPLDEATTVLVQSPTGGIAQGDRRDVRITAGPDAVAHVSTQSSTKVFSMETNYAQADLSLSVASGGHLEYLPEPTILHPDSRFCQSLSLSVAADASAVVGDIVVPGRLARGEAFDFERYYARTTIRGPDDLLAEDATHLHPEAESPRTAGVLGDDAVYGTLFVVAPSADTGTLSDDIHDAVTAARDDAKAGATALPNGAGVTVRALGSTTEPVQQTLHAGWRVTRRSLRDAPVPRRRK
jgi:urease accessory protein